MPQPQSIVIIDDDVEIRALMELALAKPGRSVTCFGDGAEAAEFILSQPRVDCIVSDVRMAGLDGFGLLARIESDSNARGTPVIFVSADDAAPDRLGAGNTNVDFLRKPFDIAELRARVDAGALRRDEPSKDFRQHVAEAIAGAVPGASSVAVLVVAAGGDGSAHAALAALTRSCLRRSDVAGDLAPYVCAVLLDGLPQGGAKDVGMMIADRLRSQHAQSGARPRVGLAFTEGGATITVDRLLAAAQEAVATPEAHSTGFSMKRAVP
ncbi:MAG TPA: response regulator [Candidatus Eremiobacteraceae bacterium]|nr:response regulator [Candidatus Eremiobacteraceae bacterium]